VIDASGLIVAPGFVDLHTHYDAPAVLGPVLQSLRLARRHVGGHRQLRLRVRAGPGEGREYLMRSLNGSRHPLRSASSRRLTWEWETFRSGWTPWTARPGRQHAGLRSGHPLLVYVMGYEAGEVPRRHRRRTRRDGPHSRRGDDGRACGWSAQRSARRRGRTCSATTTARRSPPTSCRTRRPCPRQGAGGLRRRVHPDLLFSGDRQSDGPLEDLAESLTAPSSSTRSPPDERCPTSTARTWPGCGAARSAASDLRQCLTTAAGFTFTFESGTSSTDSEAWREVTLGTPAERLAKFAAPPAGRAEEQPAIVFDLNRLVILRTMTDKSSRPRARCCPMPPASSLCDMSTSRRHGRGRRAETLFQADTSTAAGSAERAGRGPYSIWGVSDGGAHTKFLTSGAYPPRASSIRRERGTRHAGGSPLAAVGPAGHCAGFQAPGAADRGAPADIVIYDYDNLTLLDERWPTTSRRGVAASAGPRDTTTRWSTARSRSSTAKDTGAVPAAFSVNGEG